MAHLIQPSIGDGLVTTASITSGRAMSTMDLLISVACIAIILVVVFVMWRIRRLKLRIGDSHIEYFPPRPDTTAKEGEGH
jgi:uncharacterized protein HemY